MKANQKRKVDFYFQYMIDLLHRFDFTFARFAEWAYHFMAFAYYFAVAAYNFDFGFHPFDSVCVV
ncbi:MAG: hypothetical protein M3R36_09800 [Bacteroidota bacterium]|nr:hypothetical protein [Bacteroidota bacterium]